MAPAGRERGKQHQKRQAPRREARRGVNGAVFEGFNPRDNAGSFITSMRDVDSDGFEDLIVFDEAHKTVGAKSKAFAALLFDANLPVRRRVFMTATEEAWPSPGPLRAEEVFRPWLPLIRLGMRPSP